VLFEKSLENPNRLLQM